MRLRKLRADDAPLMFEWMQDSDITRNFRTDFASQTLADVERFIRTSQDTAGDVKRAVVSDSDEYMGTVSLKHIDHERRDAEFAIVMRHAAMGKGFAWYGMKSILDIAFNEIDLCLVYWNVFEKNLRAISFYDKHQFQKTTSIPESALERYRGVEGLKWYKAKKSEDNNHTIVNSVK